MARAGGRGLEFGLPRLKTRPAGSLTILSRLEKIRYFSSMFSIVPAAMASFLLVFLSTTALVAASPAHEVPESPRTRRLALNSHGFRLHAIDRPDGGRENLALLSGRSELKAMDSRILLASEALDRAASEADSAAWESAVRTELEAHPWMAPAASRHAFDPTIPAVAGRDGCVELSAAGPYRVSLPDLAAGATALRLRTQATGAAAGLVGIREVALFPAVGSVGKSLARTPMYRSGEPEAPLVAGGSDMHLRPVEPDIVQMSLPGDLTAVAGHTVEILLEWPDQVPGRLCGLVSTMPRPLSFDAEVALRTPAAKRDSRMQAIVVASFAQRSPQFASLREALLAAEQERAAFQRRMPEAIQGSIREPSAE